MPANQGRTPANWGPQPDFQRSGTDVHAMRERDWQPKSAKALAQFLCAYAVLPEMEPYEHDATGLASVADDVADRIWLPNYTADELVDLYLLLGDELKQQPLHQAQTA